MADVINNSIGKVNKQFSMNLAFAYVHKKLLTYENTTDVQILTHPKRIPPKLNLIMD